MRPRHDGRGAVSLSRLRRQQTFLGERTQYGQHRAAPDAEHRDKLAFRWHRRIGGINAGKNILAQPVQNLDRGLVHQKVLHCTGLDAPI
ncbi:hypothetical protein SDC9_118677 [bioreactor metagenome]|uniref:Uncharacterized protein n=1 Tax=bioreactor metagenome TaxID=1076179 RepID=A0A645C3C3_9ZZZZ